jgi:small-conductance mechanosensitive channel
VESQNRLYSGLEAFQNEEGLTVIRWPPHWAAAIAALIGILLVSVIPAVLLLYLLLRAAVPLIWTGLSLVWMLLSAVLLILVFRSLLSKSLIVDNENGLLTIKRFLYKRVVPLGEITEVRLRLYGGSERDGWVVLGTKAERQICIAQLGDEEPQSYDHLIRMCSPGIEIIADSLGVEAVYDPDPLGQDQN